ncbi:MAG: hypothetical protein ACFFDF_19040 [Candidatus Odinarchaeota archaeon]
MTNKLDKKSNKIELKDLTKKQKREISQHYFEQFKPMIQELTSVASYIIQNKDVAALYFLLDIIKGITMHITNKIDNDENKDINFKDINFDDYICGWKKE